MARVLQTAAAAVVFAIGSIAPAGAQEDTEAVAGLYTGNQTEVGFAGFSGELLKRRGQDFELARHGITIRFRKVDPDQ